MKHVALSCATVRLVHVGGPIKHLVAPLAETGIDGIEGVAGPPQSDISPADIWKAVGPEFTLWGGIPQDFLLATRDKEDFEATVIQAVQETVGDNQMILGVADRVPVDAELDRLEAIPKLIKQALTG